MDKEHLLHCPNLDTKQVPKNTIKHYWDARAMITSPSYAIATKTSFTLLNISALKNCNTVNIGLFSENSYKNEGKS